MHFISKVFDKSLRNSLKRINFIFNIILCTIFFISIHFESAADEWRTTVIDAPNYLINVAPDIDSNIRLGGIASDANGYPHISYGDTHLYYAYMNSNGWHYELVDNRLLADGYYNSVYSTIKIDSSGFAHILYCDLVNDLLKYTSNESGEWEIETIGPSGFVDCFSMTLDSSDKVHIFFYNVDVGARYATNSSGTWQITNLANPSGNPFWLYSDSFCGGSSIVTDSSDNIHVCYIYYDKFNEGFVNYASNKSGSWVVEKIESIGFYSSGDFPKIIMDPSGNGHVSYTVRPQSRYFPGSCYGDCYYSDFRYATYISGVWTVNKIATYDHYDPEDNTLPELVTEDGRRIDFGILIDSLGKPYFTILYSDNGLKLYTNYSGIWESSIINNIEQLRFEDIEVDPSGNNHIFYIDTSEKLLMYSTDSNIETQNIQLLKGWNLISTSLNHLNGKLSVVCDSIKAKYRSIWSFESNQWKVYNPDNVITSDLNRINHSKGYWIYMKEASDLAIRGSNISASIYINEGWNLVGYNFSSIQSVDTAMQSISGKYFSVWSYENGQWKVYDPSNLNLSDLSDLVPGRGYWIKAKVNCVWTVN